MARMTVPLTLGPNNSYQVKSQSGDDFLIWMTECPHISACLWHSNRPSDVWFHVEGCKGAHVYLRLPHDCTLDEIPEAVLQECCLLARHYSEIGRTAPWLPATIMYTMAYENLNRDVENEELAMQGQCVKNPEAVRRHVFNVRNGMRGLLHRLRNTGHMVVHHWKGCVVDVGHGGRDDDAGVGTVMDAVQAAEQARAAKIRQRQQAKAALMTQRTARQKQEAKGRDRDRRSKMDV